MRHEHIAIHKIIRPTEPHRLNFHDQEQRELEHSIEQQGLIHPILVRQLGDTYEIIAGDRRYQAHVRLRLSTIECKVREATDLQNDEAARFQENFERADLSPMEEAVAIDRALQKASMNLEEVARTVNRSKDWVRDRLELLELQPELAECVHTKRLGIAGALALKKITDDAHRAYLLRYTLDAGATLATIREWVRAWEFAQTAGDGSEAPRPEMPFPGQPVIIQMPCYVCHGVLPHDQLRILRVCPACTHELAGAGVAQQQGDPSTAADPARAEA